MFSIKKSQRLVLRQSMIDADTNLLLKNSYDRFSDKLSSLNLLERRDIKLDPNHRQLAHKNDAL